MSLKGREYGGDNNLVGLPEHQRRVNPPKPERIAQQVLGVGVLAAAPEVGQVAGRIGLDRLTFGGSQPRDRPGRRSRLRWRRGAQRVAVVALGAGEGNR